MFSNLKKERTYQMCIRHAFICPYKMLFHAMMSASDVAHGAHTSKIPSMKMWLAEVTVAHFGNVATACAWMHCTLHIAHLWLDWCHWCECWNPIFHDICHVKSNSSNDNKSISIWKSHIRLAHRKWKSQTNARNALNIDKGYKFSTIHSEYDASVEHEISLKRNPILSAIC